jgi:uncharacterized membrane protein
MGPRSESKPQPLERALWLDRLRGVAAIGMVSVHVTHAVLRDTLHDTTGFHVADVLFGLVAPAFLFCVGASFALKSDLPPGPRLARAAGLFALGYLMHVSGLVGFLRKGARTELELFLQADILQVIALALALLAVLAWLSPAHWRTCALLLGVAAFGLSPFITSRAAGLPAVVAPYVTYAVPTQFPLFPWLGHALVAAALVFGRRRLLLVCCGALVLSAVCLPLPLPPHDPFRAGPAYAAARFAAIALLGWLLGLPRLPSRVDSLLALFGRRSLFLYVVHVALVYGRHPLSLRSRVGPVLGPWGVALAIVLTLALMTLATWIWDKRRASARAPRVRS